MLDELLDDGLDTELPVLSSSSCGVKAISASAGVTQP
jgi:hypothetical protein